MINVSGIDIINFYPGIEEYSRYNKDPHVFDKYINSGIEYINNYLKNKQIIVNDIYDSNENLKNAYLSYICYSFYVQTNIKTNDGIDRIIKDLESKYKDYIIAFINEIEYPGTKSQIDLISVV